MVIDIVIKSDTIQMGVSLPNGLLQLLIKRVRCFSFGSPDDLQRDSMGFQDVVFTFFWATSIFERETGAGEQSNARKDKQTMHREK